MKQFIEPTIEINKFDVEDVITTSSEIEETEGSGDNWGGGRV